jgi:hypothetical protein
MRLELCWNRKSVNLKKLKEETMKNKASFGLLASCLIFLGATYAVAQGNATHHSADAQAAHESAPPNLVQVVRGATKQFADVNVATGAGYAQFLGCVTGPDHGAMGVHYVNGALLNGVLDASQPPALIYEPSDDGMRLVGVEYILFADAWLASHNNTPPVLDGQVFQFVDSPNRFNIPAFFELHVWAWRDNPNGAFVDWNTKVNCEGK